MHHSTEPNTLGAFSDQLANAVEHGAQSIVAVHARPRLASTGVHWRDGFIVTTEATVRRTDNILVTLPDGRRVPATLRGRDPSTDLAILKVEGADVPAAEIGDSAQLKPGHLALALARLDDSGPRASLGAVSVVGGRWRTWKGGEFDRLLQSGLALYPGFGGGPLIDAAGRTHGINSGGLSQQLATTIPVQTIERVLAHVLANGYVPRGWLGAGMQPAQLSAHVREHLGLERGSGLLVVSVEHDGPAALGGLLIGDVVMAVSGHAVVEPDDVIRAMGSDAVGKTITLDVVRGGARAHLDVLVGERPRSAGGHGERSRR